MVALVAFVQFDVRNPLEHRIAFLCFIDNLLEIVMGDNRKGIDILVAGAMTTVRQAQTTSDSLLNEDSRV